MVAHEDDNAEALDRAFMALADPTRRAIVARLSRGDAAVNEWADPFTIAKQAVSKHIQVLEQAGLATRSRDAQGGPRTSPPRRATGAPTPCSTRCWTPRPRKGTRKNRERPDDHHR